MIGVMRSRSASATGDDALERVRWRLTEARGSAGGVAIVDTQGDGAEANLLRATSEVAGELGITVLAARGRAAERDYPFGVALQLFEPWWLAADQPDRTAAAAGGARIAGEFLDGSLWAAVDSGRDREYPLIHGLFRLTSNLATRTAHPADHNTLALIVVDAQCADAPSMRFLDYLAERIGELPVLVVLGVAAGEPLAPSSARIAGVDLPPTAAGGQAALVEETLRASLRGEPRASVRQLADAAWGGGALLRKPSVSADSVRRLSAALLYVDEVERALEICDAALADAGPGLDPAEHAGLTGCRAWPLYEQARILEAAADAHLAITACDDGMLAQVNRAYRAFASSELQRGLVRSAEALLADLEAREVSERVQSCTLLEVRARLRLAQNRPREALADATEAGARLEQHPAIANPGVVAWRSAAALALLALGDPDRASALASEELEQAKRIGVTRITVRDLRVLGLAAGGAEGIRFLEEAVATAGRGAHRLEYIYALADLGSALRRANQRVAARAPLESALALSRRGGANALAGRVQGELASTSARRDQTLTGLASLTPRERQVADLAARGVTTRGMASILFVSAKTVEYHLRNIYRKLDVGSRVQLAAVWNASEAG